MQSISFVSHRLNPSTQMSTTKYSTADDYIESSWVQTGQSLLRRGWSVGKKVAVAGAAISAAPVVIPPLLVFSAFGLALSVPFGIFYAGMVGTERLMQSLLPLDQDQEVAEPVNQGEEDDVLEQEEEKGYSDERGFKPEENWESEGDDEIAVQGEGYLVKWDTKKEEIGGEQEINGDTIAEDLGETEVATNEYGEINKNYGVVGYLDERDEMVENNVSKRGLMLENEGNTTDDVVVDIPKEPVHVVEENGGMKRDFMKRETDNNNVTVERILDVTSATVDNNSVTIVAIEIKPDEADSTTMNEQGTELAGAAVIQAETENTEVIDDKGMVTADTDSKVSKKEENDLSGISLEGADVSEVEDSNALASASSESSVTSDVEEFYTKKELWDQLRALRTIVGYRAAIAKTLPGELRALYSFTGVEMPSTATDASNLLDLNYKLQFLKSIIGVK